MKFFDKAKKFVQDAKDEVEEATTEEIDYQERQGYMRQHKGEPMNTDKNKDK